MTYYILLLTYKTNLSKIKDKHWLKNVKLPYIIVYGDETIQDDYLYKKDENILIVKTPDTYEYITLKLACAYKALLNMPQTNNLKGLFKIDDDVVVNINRLHHFISLPIKHDYVGHTYLIKDKTLCSHHQTKVKDKCLKNITFTFNLSEICYGPMYYLSKYALQTIVGKFSYHNFSTYSTDIFEDYTFGNILKKSNINPICMEMYTDDLNHFSIYNFIAFHDFDHSKNIINIDKIINTQIN
jgi:hypothetical protein